MSILDILRFAETGNMAMPCKGGSSSGTTSGGTTIQKTEPPAYLQPYLTDIASKAQAAYGQVPTGGFSGQLVATPTPGQLSAVDAQKTIAQNLTNSGFGNTTMDAANSQAQKLASGFYTAPLNNTFNPTALDTTAITNASIAPVLDKLQNTIIPTLQSNAISSGAYGGSRYFADMGQQINDNFTKEAANIAAQLGYGEQVRQQDQAFKGWQTNQQLSPELFKAEQAAALATPELTNSGVQQLLTPSSILNQAGTQEQLWNQDQLDQAYQQYLLDVAGPFAGLDQYASIVGGMPTGSTTTSTSTAPRTNSSFLSGALGGGLGGYGLASALSLSNPWTAGLALGGGLLGGLLS